MEKFVACIEILCNLCYWESKFRQYTHYTVSVLSCLFFLNTVFLKFFLFFYKVFALLSFILKTFPDMVLE